MDKACFIQSQQKKRTKENSTRTRVVHKKNKQKKITKLQNKHKIEIFKASLVFMFKIQFKQILNINL